MWPPLLSNEDDYKANGIMVGKAKLFDVTALRKMLNDTATQLSTISGFNAASITAALGNLQGVTRDTSFLSAQITTTPVPAVTNTVTSGLNGNASTAVNSSTPGTAATTVT